MTLAELMAGVVEPGGGAGSCRVVGDGSVRVSDVTDDSRTVVPGSLFVARSGTAADGRSYIAEAVRAGAVAILTDEAGGAVELPARSSVPVVYAWSAGLAAAQVAERFYGHPARALDLVGVTGTNGKTTITHLVHQVLNGSGVRCGLIGTVVIDDGREVAAAMLTTPPAIELSRTLATMVEHGCRSAVMECSSHALDQGRVSGLSFDVAVFTNLTRDHLDYHGTMERYAAAKAKLFEMLPADGWAVVNGEDPWTGRMVRDCRARVVWCRIAGEGEEVCTVGRGHGLGVGQGGEPEARACAVIRGMGMGGTAVEFVGPWGRFEARLGLVGRHNVMNALQAVSAAWCVGVPPRVLAEQVGLASAPSGRLEPVTGVDEPWAVLVDYAHTDDAIRQVLGTLRPLVPAGGRLGIVFGCGGDRDATKRPLMGLAAAELADAVFVTSDNPRTEKPSAIIDAILGGIPAGLRGKVRVDADRGRAIAQAVGWLGAGDILLIAGKGHEDYQIVPDGKGGTVRTSFDDRVVARAALEQRQAAGAGSA